MRLVFAGTPQVALASLRRLLEGPDEVVGVITRPDAPAGRGRRMTASPVAALAVEAGVPVLKPAHPRDPGFQAELAALEPDCCPVVAYGALLPASALAVPRYGWVNLHFSLLPRWRGAAPVQRAIWAGDPVSGVTTFRIVRELDAGPVYRRLEVPIAAGETSGELLARLADVGAGVLAETMWDVAGGVAPRDQPADGVTLAAKLEVADARIDWSARVEVIERLVRACTPDPGAWTLLDGERLKIVRVAKGGQPDLAPGECSVSKREVQVGTGTRPLRLVSVQPMGKKEMAGADWARGLRRPEPRFT